VRREEEGGGRRRRREDGGGGEEGKVASRHKKVCKYVIIHLPLPFPSYMYTAQQPLQSH